MRVILNHSEVLEEIRPPRKLLTLPFAVIVDIVSPGIPRHLTFAIIHHLQLILLSQLESIIFGPYKYGGTMIDADGRS